MVVQEIEYYDTRSVCYFYFSIREIVLYLSGFTLELLLLPMYY